MINRTKRDLKTKIYLFTALVIIGGALPATLSIAANAAPPGGMGQDHKGWAFGPIASIQNDKDGKPAWVLSGHWATNIINKTKESFNQTNPAKFDAWITMVMLNGSAMHKHRISNFSLTDASTQDKTSTYKGTVTITMTDANTEKMVWQGWSTDEVDSRHMSTKEIQSSVRAIFRKFDVAKN